MRRVIVTALWAVGVGTMAGAAQANDCNAVVSLLQQGYPEAEVAYAMGLSYSDLVSCVDPLSGPRDPGVGRPFAAPRRAAGPAPRGAPGPAPRGAAGAAPMGAAGRAPLGAAGPPPRAAAGLPPLGAAGGR
jgi:hypothetical protein